MTKKYAKIHENTRKYSKNRPNWAKMAHIWAYLPLIRGIYTGIYGSYRVVIEIPLGIENLPQPRVNALVLGVILPVMGNFPLYRGIFPNYWENTCNYL